MNLAQEALSGLVWTFFSRTGTRIIIFLISIILARLLQPADFGLVAILGIFFAISGSIVDSGFTSALIREKEISLEDKTTVFNINLIISLTIYFFLWLGSTYIADFFNEQKLIWLMRLMGLDIIFKALTIVQRAELFHQLKFKVLTFVDLTASIITGIVAIYFAYHGWGVWALAFKYVASSFSASILLWTLNPWIPKSFINRDSFNRLFKFGSNLLITGIINTLFTQVYNLVIGKFYSPVILGFYNRAFLFTNQLLSTIVVSIYQATYPILSKTKEKPEVLKIAYQKTLIAVTFVNFPLAIGLALVAEPLILLLLGEKWIETVPFLQILCAGAIINHISSLNNNLIKVVGKSELILKISIVSKILTIIVIIIGILTNIWILLLGSVIVQYVEAFMYIFFTKVLINYSIFEQLSDIFKIIKRLIPMVLTILIIDLVIKDLIILKLVMMVTLGTLVYLITSYISKSSALENIMIILKTYNQKIS